MCVAHPAIMMILIFLAGAFIILYAYFWARVHGYRHYVDSKVSLDGKTVIITGGNSGIGKETAIDLAQRGARVILACRNPLLAEKAVKEIQRRSGNPHVVYRHLDLASPESVKEFARTFLEEEQRLDILVNNAGVANGAFIKKPPLRTPDGFDLVFGVNHLGHFLLTLLLLDRLKQCSPSRIILVSSGMHMLAQDALDFKPLSSDGLRYPGLSGYPISKAANVMFARELSKRLNGTGVTAFSLNPGIVYTSAMVKESPSLHAFAFPLFWLLCTSERTGAQGSIHCAVADDITQYSGSYFENCKPHPVLSWIAEDDAVARKLWDVSCKAVGIEYN